MACKTIGRAKLPNESSSWEQLRPIVSLLSKTTDQTKATSLLNTIGLEAQGRFDAFDGLHFFFTNYSTDEGTAEYYGRILPSIAQFALRCEVLNPNVYKYKYEYGPPITSFDEMKYNRLEIATLIAVGYLCLFPIVPTGQMVPTGKDKPAGLNFTTFYRHLFDSPNGNHAKFQCLNSYFKKLTEELATGMAIGGVIQVKRYTIGDTARDFEAFINDNGKLSMVAFREQGDDGDIAKIEDGEPNYACMVDFANKTIGSSMLSGGSCQEQEEILFMEYPEAMITMLQHCEMGDDEVIYIIGCRRYAWTSGVGTNLIFKGSFQDEGLLDNDNNFARQIMAMAATKYEHGKEQYSKENLYRDIFKAYAAFYQPHLSLSTVNENEMTQHLFETTFVNPFNVFNLDITRKRSPSTGNWGCGSYNGDPQLKFLIQLLAASHAKLPGMIYHTQGHADLDMAFVVNDYLRTQKYTVSTLAKLIAIMAKTLEHECLLLGEPNTRIFKYIARYFH